MLISTTITIRVPAPALSSILKGLFVESQSDRDCKGPMFTLESVAAHIRREAHATTKGQHRTNVLRAAHRMIQAARTAERHDLFRIVQQRQYLSVSSDTHKVEVSANYSGLQIRIVEPGMTPMQIKVSVEELDLTIDEWFDALDRGEFGGRA